MATTSNLRKLLHRKSWEMCTSSPTNATSGSFIVADAFNAIAGSPVFFVNAVSGVFAYDGDEDAWTQLPNSGIAGTFGAGSCGEFRALGAMGGVFTQTATAGTTTTITTNRTIVASLAGKRIRVIAGTGIGYDGTVASNTMGANAIITVTTPSGVAFDNTTQYQVYSGSLWFFNAGSGAVGFAVYDTATNAWTQRSVTGLPTTFGTDGQLVSTIGCLTPFATGTATAGGASTITNGGKAWVSNMWANYQVRITAGTGIGQIRVIASNTDTAITVSSAWDVQPDATSVYAIEGNGDVFYLIGNNAVTMYQFTVSTNSWVTITPTAARTGAAGIAASANWITGVTGWNSETPELLYSTTMYRQNGRYLFSFRGGATSTLDIFDLAARTWVSAVPYGNQLETFTTGSSSCNDEANIYLQKDATGRLFRLDLEKFSLVPIATDPGLQGGATAGTKVFLLPYKDGATTLKFLYKQINVSAVLFRMLLI